MIEFLVYSHPTFYKISLLVIKIFLNFIYKILFDLP